MSLTPAGAGGLYDEDSKGNWMGGVIETGRNQAHIQYYVRGSHSQPTVETRREVTTQSMGTTWSLQRHSLGLKASPRGFSEGQDGRLDSLI